MTYETPDLGSLPCEMCGTPVSLAPGQNVWIAPRDRDEHGGGTIEFSDFAATGMVFCSADCMSDWRVRENPYYADSEVTIRSPGSL